MPKTISGPVGRGGRNFPPSDVMTVQYLLNCVPTSQGGPSPELVVDGAVGPKTIKAIETFQRKNGGTCDGRVDPGGNTMHTLQGRDPYPHQALSQGSAKGGQAKGGDAFGAKGYGQGGSKGGDAFGAKGYGQGGSKGGDAFGAKGYGQGGSKGGDATAAKGGGPFGGRGGFGKGF